MTEVIASEQVLPLGEVLNPRHTPELAFQSYELFNDDPAKRNEQKRAFMADEVENPVLYYPDIQKPALHHGINVLNNVLALADQQADAVVRDAIWGSAAYRMAEMYWVEAMHDLNGSYTYMRNDQLDAKAAATQELNEQLYGKPEAEIVEQVYGEIWSLIPAEGLSPDAEQLRAELQNGFEINIGERTIRVAGLANPDGQRLPNSAKMLDELRARLEVEYADFSQLVDQYWDERIAGRPEDERAFTADDMYQLFKAAHTLRDPEDTSGVKIMIDPNATQLAYSIMDMAVKVGGERKPISSKKVMLGKLIHEYGVHATRALNGSTTELPVLGTGLYTEADDGEQSDYMTFEEGLGGLCETAIQGKKTLWDVTTLDRYFAVAQAYAGKDFRQVYETLWRVRVLMGTKPAEAIDPKRLEKAKSAAFATTVRIFRSTPTAMPRVNHEGKPRMSTFNKDLAYLKGKLLAIKFWDEHGDNPEMLGLLFKAKFDPTNKRQLALAQQFVK